MTDGAPLQMGEYKPYLPGCTRAAYLKLDPQPVGKSVSIDLYLLDVSILVSPRMLVIP